MRIAIVDDINSDQKELHNRLSAILCQYSVDAAIFEYSSGEAFLSAAQNERFELVFLDIYMNGANGVETAKKLRTFDQECIIVFTTSSTDYALEGFKVKEGKS